MNRHRKLQKPALIIPFIILIASFSGYPAENNQVEKKKAPDKADSAAVKEKVSLDKNPSPDVKTSPEKIDAGKIKDKERYEKEKKKAEWIKKVIDYDIHRERARAIDEILTIKNESLRAELEEKLIHIIENEINADVKIKAITVAGELKLKDAVPGLIKSLDDETDDIRINAVYSMKKIGDTSAKPVLIEKLREQDLSENSTYIIALLETLGEFKAVELQKEAVQWIENTETTKNNRELLVIFLGKTGSKDSKDLLLKLLTSEDEDVDVRALAANSLAKLDLAETSGAINDTVKKIESYPFKKRTRYYKLYIYCIGALARLGDESALPRLMDSLRSNNASVRLYAIKLLREFKDKRTIDILKHKVKYDPSVKVRHEAGDALREIEANIEKEKKAQEEKNKIGNKTPDQQGKSNNSIKSDQTDQKKTGSVTGIKKGKENPPDKQR